MQTRNEKEEENWRGQKASKRQERERERTSKGNKVRKSNNENITPRRASVSLSLVL